jgi:hypothetical protein
MGRLARDGLLIPSRCTLLRERILNRRSAHVVSSALIVSAVITDKLAGLDSNGFITDLRLTALLRDS